MIAFFIIGSFEVNIFGSTRIWETCNLLLEVLQCSFMISWNDNMKDDFPLFASWLESKIHCFAILVSGRPIKVAEHSFAGGQWY